MNKEITEINALEQRIVETALNYTELLDLKIEEKIIRIKDGDESEKDTFDDIYEGIRMLNHFASTLLKLDTCKPKGPQVPIRL